jgi:hypothetical protein
MADLRTWVQEQLNHEGHEDHEGHEIIPLEKGIYRNK